MEEKTTHSILVVDDDATSRKKLCRILQRLGFEKISEAEQGDEALTMLKEQPMDLVLADWHMPGLNGLDLLKAIRADEQIRETAVYLVTTEGRQAQIVAAIQAGATGYIMKPFSQESIKGKLGNLIPGDATPVKSSEESTVDKNHPTEISAPQETTSSQEAEIAPVG